MLIIVQTNGKMTRVPYGIVKESKNEIFGYELADVCTVRSPKNELFYFKKHIKIYIKIHINIAPIYFDLRPSSGSLH